MKQKSVMFLAIFSVSLLLVLLGELYYLFVFKKQAGPDDIVSTVSKEKNLSNLYQKRTLEEVAMALDAISSKTQALKPLLRSGVVKGLEMIESYRSVITEIGPIHEDVKVSKSRTITYVFSIKFATMGEKGEKQEFGYKLTENELKRVTTLRAVGSDTVPLPLNQLQKGDFVSITTHIDIMTQLDNLMTMEIVKLL